MLAAQRAHSGSLLGDVGCGRDPDRKVTRAAGPKPQLSNLCDRSQYLVGINVVNAKLSRRYLAPVRCGDGWEHVAHLRGEAVMHGDDPEVMSVFAAADVQADDHPLATVETNEVVQLNPGHALVKLGRPFPVGVGHLSCSPMNPSVTPRVCPIAKRFPSKAERASLLGKEGRLLTSGQRPLREPAGALWCPAAASALTGRGHSCECVPEAPSGHRNDGPRGLI